MLFTKPSRVSEKASLHHCKATSTLTPSTCEPQCDVTLLVSNHAVVAL